MSRDSSGVMTLPLPDVVAGDVIEAAWANTTLNDVKAELTDSLSRSGKGNMSAALKVIAGTVSAPGLSFTSEANSGFYRASAGDIRMALGSAEAWRVTSAGFRAVGAVTAMGDFIVGTAGDGVDFAVQTATAATGATTTKEILTHYEEGTWTPNLWDLDFNSSKSQTYSTQTGIFTRIGRVVHISGSLVVTSLGTLSTNDTMQIGPLPYPSASSAAQTAGYISVMARSIPGISAGETPFGQASTGSYISFGVDQGTTTTGITIAEFGATGFINFSGYYFV